MTHSPEIDSIIEKQSPAVWEQMKNANRYTEAKYRFLEENPVEKILGDKEKNKTPNVDASGILEYILSPSTKLGDVIRLFKAIHLLAQPDLLKLLEKAKTDAKLNFYHAKYEQALACYDCAIRLDSTDEVLFYNKAYAFTEKN
jgi:hypothetical protein